MGKNVLDVRIAALVVPKKTMDIAAAASIIHRTYALDCGFSEGKAAIFFYKTTLKQEKDLGCCMILGEVLGR